MLPLRSPRDYHPLLPPAAPCMPSSFLHFRSPSPLSRLHLLSPSPPFPLRLRFLPPLRELPPRGSGAAWAC
ncbi:unnamed protein product, partial [Closterium sp. NIES-65]